MDDDKEKKVVRLAHGHTCDDVKETLETCLKESSEYSCVMVLAITKGGGQRMRGSMLSPFERIILGCFAQAIALKYWDDVSPLDDPSAK